MYNNIALYTVLLEQVQQLNRKREQADRDFIPDYAPEKAMPRTQLSAQIKR